MSTRYPQSFFFSKTIDGFDDTMQQVAAAAAVVVQTPPLYCVSRASINNNRYNRRRATVVFIGKSLSKACVFSRDTSPSTAV